MNDSTTRSIPIIEELTMVFREVFDDDDLVLHDSTTAADIPGWDSQNHVVLILAVEQRFGVRFRTSELDVLRDVGNFVQLLAAKLASR